MFGFLVKKAFFDMWDNLFRIIIMNLGYIAVFAIFFLLAPLFTSSPGALPSHFRRGHRHPGGLHRGGQQDVRGDRGLPSAWFPGFLCLSEGKLPLEPAVRARRQRIRLRRLHRLPVLRRHEEPRGPPCHRPALLGDRSVPVRRSVFLPHPVAPGQEVPQDIPQILPVFFDNPGSPSVFFSAP